MEAEEQVMSEVHLGCPADTKSYVTVFTISPSASTSRGDLEHNIESNGSRKEPPSCQQFMFDKEGDLVLPRRKSKQRDGLYQAQVDLATIHCTLWMTKDSPLHTKMKKAKFKDHHSRGILQVQHCNHEDKDQVRFTHDSILIHHHVTTDIPSVGLQVWRASLLLADFILHTIHTSVYLNDVVALELGAGTGLVGILLAHAARTVFVTDRGEDILNNCLRNVELNCHTYKHTKNSVRVRELDWQNPWPPKVIQSEEAFMESHEYKYAWNSYEIDEAEEASILLAADVVYSDELTDAFFGVLRKLMPRGSKKVLFLSLEKRYNFALEDFDIVAHGYTHFRKFFEEDMPGSTGCAKCQPSFIESGRITVPCFTGKRLDVAQIPQYVRQYDRGNDLELWEISAQPHNGT